MQRLSQLEYYTNVAVRVRVRVTRKVGVWVGLVGVVKYTIEHVLRYLR